MWEVFVNFGGMQDCNQPIAVGTDTWVAFTMEGQEVSFVCFEEGYHLLRRRGSFKEIKREHDLCSFVSTC